MIVFIFSYQNFFAQRLDKNMAVINLIEKNLQTSWSFSHLQMCIKDDFFKYIYLMV